MKEKVMPAYYKGEESSLTGKVYITMTRSTTEGKSLFVKKHKAGDDWVNLEDWHEDFGSCHAFSKQAAQKLIKHLEKIPRYREDVETGLLEFGTWPEYAY